jgi:hypothetical protein
MEKLDLKESFTAEFKSDWARIGLMKQFTPGRAIFEPAAPEYLWQEAASLL